MFDNESECPGHRRPRGRRLVNLNRKSGCLLSYSVEKNPENTD